MHIERPTPADARPVDRTGSLVEVREVLAHHPPFDTLSAAALDRLAESADVGRYAAGELVLDAFADPSPSVYVVLRGTAGTVRAVPRSGGGSG